MGSVVDDVFNGGQARSERDKATAIGKDNAASFRDLVLPTIDWENYNPEAYNPELIDYKTISEDPAIRAMQLKSLEKMATLSDTGLSAQDELGYLKAQNAGSQLAKSGTDAAIQSAAARGVSGSGLEFALREIANQSGAQRAQEAALQQAADAAKQRASYDMAYNSALTGQRGQDFSVNKANTDIINQYNQANTGIKNSGIATNVQNRNEAQKYNQTGKNSVAQQRFENDLTKRQNIAGSMNQVAQNHLANSAGMIQQGNAIIGAGATLGGAAMGGPAGAKAGQNGASIVATPTYDSGARTAEGDWYRS